MWEGLDMEMDAAFLARDACRKAGRPVEVARTERLLIRESVLEDVPGLYRIWQEAGEYVQPMQPTLEEEAEFMEAYIRYAYSFYDFGLWTILEKKSGQIVGRAGLFPSKILDGGVEMGYMVAPACRRQGYALECGRAILQYAFEVLDLTEVHLLADIRNTASIKTAEALGFEKRGFLGRGDAKIMHFLSCAP